MPYLQRLRGVFTTRRYTNPRLPYLTLPRRIVTNLLSCTLYKLPSLLTYLHSAGDNWCSYRRHGDESTREIIMINHWVVY